MSAVTARGQMERASFAGGMLRPTSLALAILVCFCSSRADAQSPSDGHVQAGSYVNSFFHFAYAWPPMLHPQDLSAMNLHQASPRGVESFLFAAQKGSEPYGVVMIAEKTRALTGNQHDFVDAADVLSRVRRTIDPTASWKPLSERHTKNESGLLIDEFDYIVDGEYSSAFIVTLDNYLIVARCNAKTVADLKTMTDSLFAIRHEK